MKTILTIDFDFFVPEDPLWDLGHNESIFFINHIWQIRANLMDVLKTNGAEKDFWKRLQECFEFKTDTIYLSESHLEAFHLTPPVGQIINIDRHHDVWEAKGNRVQCDTWAFQAMRLRHAQGMKWVHPTDGHFAGVEDYLAVVPEDFRDRVEPMTLDAMLERMKGTRIDTVHVCRSGAWTPPWLDKDFDEFLSSAPMQCVAPVGALDICHRWKEKDFEAAREHQAITEKFYAENRRK